MELVRHAVNPTDYGPVVMEAKVFGAEEAFRMGIAHRLVSPDSLIGDATDLATRLGSFPGTAYRDAKMELRGATLQGMRNRTLESHRACLKSLTNPAIRAHVQKTLQKKG